MKYFHYLSLIALFSIALINSCSTEEEDTSPPPALVQPQEPEPPAPTQYTLTVTSGEGGTVSTEGGTYDEGTEITINATPDEGYEFVGWEGSDSDSNSLSITLNADVNFQAIFGLKYKSFLINIDHPQSQEMIENFGITANSNVMFKKNGVIHLISNPSNPRGEFESLLPTVHLVKKNDTIYVSNFYNIGMSFGGRDVQKFGTNYDFIWADHGTEVWLGGGQGTPFNNIWVGKNISEQNIEWIKVNSHRSFYHSVSSGDLNYDGLVDVVGIHMGTNSPNIIDNEPYHVFIQNSDGTFTQDYELLPSPNIVPFTDCWDNFDIYGKCYGVSRGSVLITDVDGDDSPEIIGGAYNHEDIPAQVHNLLQISFDEDKDGIYERLEIVPKAGWMNFDSMGTTQLNSIDYDFDGDDDLIISFEGNYDQPHNSTATFNGIQIYDNDGLGNFTFSGKEIAFDDLRTSEFELYDIDNDGDLDIVFSAQLFIDLGTSGGAETSFYYRDQNILFKKLSQNKSDSNWQDTLIDFDQLIYYNEEGSFIKRDNGNEVLIHRGKSSVNFMPGRGIETLNSSFIDGELIFYLYKTDVDQTGDITLELIEFKPNTIEQ